MSLKAFDYEVFGKVQGVFFRKFTITKAQELGLVGWVMNTPQGTVVGQAEGSPTKIDQLKHWLATTGSPKSKIEKCDIKNERSIEKLSFKAFEVRKIVLMKYLKSQAKYSSVPTHKNDGHGLFDETPCDDLAKAEQGLSYKSIFTYSTPSGSSSSNGHFAEYWRSADHTVINEPRTDESSILSSFFYLFLHPPFAKSSARSRNQSAIREVNDLDNASKIVATIFEHFLWTVMLLIFTSVWLVLLPFHWYFTISRIRLNEAVVIFRVGQAPLVWTKPGTFICRFPMLDRLHRVSLARRGFSIPPTQVSLRCGTVVRIGGEISFHITDPLRFIRMSSDTATSIRHVVHGQFISFLGTQSAENLKRFNGGVQTELRQICSRHLSQFGVFVDTFTVSSYEVVREPPDAGRELIDTILNAIGNPGSMNALSSALSSAIPFLPQTTPQQTSGPEPQNESAPDLNSNVDAHMANRITQFLTEALNASTHEVRASLGLGSSDVFKLQLGAEDCWLLYPYSGRVDGPVRPEQTKGIKERGSLYVQDWATLETLRDGKLSAVSGYMSGRLSASGDVAILAKLFDPSKLHASK